MIILHALHLVVILGGVVFWGLVLLGLLDALLDELRRSRFPVKHWDDDK